MTTKTIQFDLDRKHFSIARSNPLRANVYDLRSIYPASLDRLSRVLNGFNAEPTVRFFADMTPQITVHYRYFWKEAVRKVVSDAEQAAAILRYNADTTPSGKTPAPRVLTQAEADQIVHDRNFTALVDDYEFDEPTGTHFYFLSDGRNLIIEPNAKLSLVDPELDDEIADDPDDFPEYDFFESDDIGGDDLDDPFEYGDMEMSERRMLREDARLDAKEARQQAVAPRQPYERHTTHAQRTALDDFFNTLVNAGMETGTTAVEMIETKAAWLRDQGAVDYADAVALVAKTLAEQQAAKSESQMTTRRARLAELLAANYGWSLFEAQHRAEALDPEAVETWYNDLSRRCAGAPYSDDYTGYL